MQQYDYLKQKFQLPKLLSLRIRSKNPITLQNGQVLVIAAWVFTIVNFFDFLHPLTILIFGLALPLYCSYLDIYVSKYYFQVLAFLLWMRLWTSTMSCFDSWLLICLWHPNIRLSEKIVQYIGSILKPKKTSLVDKIDQKIGRLLD